MMDLLYPYTTPAGYGDTFFMYAYSANANALVSGTDYNSLSIPIQDGDFVCRSVGGQKSIAPNGLILYDQLLRRCSSNYVKNTGYVNQLVLPERVYPVNNSIKFDISNANIQANNDGVKTGQLVFTGVRRRLAVAGDPQPSPYNYYEADYMKGNEPTVQTSFTLTISTAAAANPYLTPTATYQIPVQNNDFELCRIELATAVGSTFQTIPCPFAIMLYDNYGNKTSNIPINSNYFCHMPIVQSNGELNFFPSPPLLYKIGSYIKFEIYSLLAAAQVPATYYLAFKGVKRIAC